MEPVDQSSKETITNQALVAEFENGHAPGSFHHADHVRVAFAFVSEFPLSEAISRFSAALKRFATAQGKPQLYHETITWSYLCLIAERLDRMNLDRMNLDRMNLDRMNRSRSWQEFAEQNSDLLVWKGGVLERYYSKAMLDSELARRTFLLPDRGL